MTAGWPERALERPRMPPRRPTRATRGPQEAANKRGKAKGPSEPCPFKRPPKTPNVLPGAPRIREGSERPLRGSQEAPPKAPEASHRPSRLSRLRSFRFYVRRQVTERAMYA